MAQAMLCCYCHKPIGFLRRIKDPNFCSDEHRRKLVTRSARALRDAEDLYGPNAAWRAVEKSKEMRPAYASTVFAMLAIVLLIAAIGTLPSASSNSRVAASSSPPEARTPVERGLIERLLGGVLQSTAQSAIREDFRTGLSNWEGLRTSNAWVFDGKYVRPTSLRIWKPSTLLSNYELEFAAQIEKRSLDWAFRAIDLRNYYATKLVVSRPGAVPNSRLVRFAVQDGHIRERTELPLPLTLEEGQEYRIRVSIQDNRFLTSVNGQIVSSWTDNLLSRGGVGFFSDEGEAALIKWVRVSERDSFIGRMVARFSLISIPAAAPAPSDF